MRITDREAYRKASIGMLNRLLVLALRIVIAVGGRPSIASTITVNPAQGPAGTGWNTYTLSKCGITLCVFNDTYQLDPDGERVVVTTDLRYGPVPGIITDHVVYGARITDSGFHSRYEGLRLLGSEWVATYAVAQDKNGVKGALVCSWAQATEEMTRQSVPQ